MIHDLSRPIPATQVSIHMRFPMNTYKGEGSSWGKLNIIANLIWFLFFKQQFPFSHILRLFQENFILVKATSSHFFRVTTLTQQLLFQDSYFFRTAAFFPLFQNSHFFAGVIFSEQLLFRSETSTEQALFENKKFFTEITFRNSYFIRRNCLG